MPNPRATFAIVILFIAGMLHSTLHAAEFGVEPHYHGDVACLLVLPEEEFDSTILPRVREPFFALRSLVLFSECQQSIYPRLTLGPPSTGPPNQE